MSSSKLRALTCRSFKLRTRWQPGNRNCRVFSSSWSQIWRSRSNLLTRRSISEWTGGCRRKRSRLRLKELLKVSRPNLRSSCTRNWLIFHSLKLMMRCHISMTTLASWSSCTLSANQKLLSSERFHEIIPTECYTLKNNIKPKLKTMSKIQESHSKFV